MKRRTLLKTLLGVVLWPFAGPTLKPSTRVCGYKVNIQKGPLITLDLLDYIERFWRSRGKKGPFTFYVDGNIIER